MGGKGLGLEELREGDARCRGVMFGSAERETETEGWKWVRGKDKPGLGEAMRFSEGRGFGVGPAILRMKEGLRRDLC